MKYIVLLGDGMADWPLKEYENRTPLEVASTPAMDQVVQRGILGQFYPIPEGMAAGSDIGNLSVFGYAPGASFRGRAPIEAAKQGISLAEDEVAFRCNLVSLQDGVMSDFTAGHITTEEAAEIIPVLNETLGKEFPAVFHTGVSYRHLTVVRASERASLEEMTELVCTPPHDISDKPWQPHLPGGLGAGMIGEMILRSQEVLADLPVNQRRVAEGKAPANSIWFWGQGKAPEMESYKDKFGLTGAVVSAVDLVKGIGVCAGLEVLEEPGWTGWIDTDYAGKIGAALAALGRHDFVYVHVEAPDETGHQGRADLKIQAIEDFDRQVVAPALAYLEEHPDTRILVAPDHVTAIATKTHAGGPVPFAVCGQGVVSNGQEVYSEVAAEASGIVIEQGHRLMQQMIEADTLCFESVVEKDNK